ncbi:hypothetical protein IMZ11_02475 [Microtetraspora sp. AC03309]|uniref:hypothetical protein n=1 Tax=Microtetraspora sp. AC03309 TaxID=2779376 RepID=UPI001E2BE5BB|nr:hypothetical protein [Microtetraspora sp. AC03309]MCC5574504.1 hypothetical protein [Microtetraspora sp. AC03309]
MTYWPHSDPLLDDDGMRDCSRAEHCTNPRRVEDDGRTVLAPALTPRAFCEADRAIIDRSLSELPELYARVHAEIGNKRQANGPKVFASKTAPVPLSPPVDALLRHMVAVLTSWEERVRVAAGLTLLDTDISRRRRDHVAVRTACAVLTAHLDTLLSLDGEPMVRGVELAELAGVAHTLSGVAHPNAGYAEVFMPLDGADAGLEVLHLHYRCRTLLSETKPPAQHLPVPCKACGFRRLYERRDWDGNPDGAVCRHCGAQYTDNEFTVHRGEVYAAEAAKRAVSGGRMRAYALQAAESDSGSGRA